MNKIRKFFTNASLTALSTITMLTVGETAINAATITGDFEITGVIGTEEGDSILGTFGGEDLDGNGILSELELTNFLVDIEVDRLTFIQSLELEDVSNFELDLEQLDFDFLFRTSTGDGVTSGPPGNETCVGSDGGSCRIETVNLSDRYSYFFVFEYTNPSTLRFLDRIENNPLSAASAQQIPFSIVEVSLNPQSVPEPSVILGILTILGLGSQLKKVK
ncbi:MAG: PEP-CTERM sorting domain-containing protein [Microcoleaceae cyanobacterium]